jgi:hypothetical protein
MNEIEELARVETKSLPALPAFALDDLHQKTLKNLHLELGSGPVLYLLSPSFSVLNPRPNGTVTDFITRSGSLLNYLKELLVQSLAAYSVLLDINSYFVEQNSYLVLARMRDRDSAGRRYEVKYYTHSPIEVLSHYEDKIYIGRDFVDLYHFPRKHFGVDEFIGSLRDQCGALIDRAEDKLANPLDYKSFFQEIQELSNELSSESDLILQSLPPLIDLDKAGGKDLIEVNAQYRAINHFLIELHDEVEEFENLLRFKQENDFVRYVTKYKKDITNLISYFNIKINGLLADKIRHCKNHKHS